MTDDAGTETEPGRESSIAEQFDPNRFDPDEIAPVDWQADPAHWLPGRSLWIVAGIIAALTIATIVVCLVIWSTPPMEPVKVPTVPRA